jgi:UDP-glucose 4-epimerase
MTLANAIDGVRRAAISPALVILSSAAVYGNPASLPVAETAPIAPISPHGFHKAACELLGREAAECMGMSVVVCRLFSVYGARQRRKLIWEVYRQLKNETAVVELKGSGGETRDFLHVDDAAKALLELARHPKRGFTVVNVASGTETSVAHLVEEMKRISDTDKMLMCHGIPQPGDPAHWTADIARLRQLAPGWHPRSLRDGLDETMEQWQPGFAAL